MTKTQEHSWTGPIEHIESWFETQGLVPLPFQRATWQAYASGQEGLIHAPTGTGKTLAAFLGPLVHTSSSDDDEPGIRILWITPLRALATDTTRALGAICETFAPDWHVEKRTSDTSSSKRQKQRDRLPEVLVTTPESLSLFLTRPKAAALFRGLRCVVVDEWHELLSSKRGTQTELALARLRAVCPEMLTWGLSATIGNLDEALRALVGGNKTGRLIKGDVDKRISFHSVIPRHIERFPWSGHMGMKMLPEVVNILDKARSSLVFCNTRNQSENWFRAILESRPDWAGVLALHHGSLAQDTRRWVEEALRDGRVRCVVCTSSLDLGVDFSPVDCVLQIGSPKGVARLIQRAGRSGHRPDAESRVYFVPTHALELAELQAARHAATERLVEPRVPRKKPYDVLAQHLVTVALGFGFEEEEMFDEVRSTESYKNLTREEWNWVLEFAATGGPALRRYNDFQRLVNHRGVYRVTTNKHAFRHRLTVGTITSDAEIDVRFRRGKKLGSVEERFISRLNPGDVFHFAGRRLELVAVRDMSAIVVNAGNKKVTTVPRWAGTRAPLSTLLSAELRLVLNDDKPSPELDALEPLLSIQRNWSRIPGADELLVERLRSEEGYHIFVYPFEGRFVHEALAALMAWRLSRIIPITFSMSATDYGIELLSDIPIPVDGDSLPELLSENDLADDLKHSMNESELAKRQFREVARVAGMVFQGYPGASKPLRHLQASTSLYFDTLQRHDPDNLLLKQAREEAVRTQLEIPRLREALTRMRAARLLFCDIDEPTPFCFPLLAERLRGGLSSEQPEQRILRMQMRLEDIAG